VRAAPVALVVDAGILMSAVLGRSASVIEVAARSISLLTTERAAEEAARRLVLGLRQPDLTTALAALLRRIEVVPVQPLSDRLDVAASVLRDAAHSRNGSVSDAHLLTLAWEADAEIWSHDRDFAGAGIASWSTINLLRAIAVSSA
jgi:predicted nucleic acid-binding protein